jgi:hypothetical protein
MGMPDGDEFEPQIPAPKLPDSFVRKHWQFVIGVGLIIIILVWFIWWPKRWPIMICLDDNCRTVVAEKVTSNTNNGLTGHFTVKRSFFNAIPSEGRAGACLFVESAALVLPGAATPPGGTCTSDAQCGEILKDDPTTTTDDAFVGWEGLCHKSSGTCWIRPGKGDLLQSEVCNKGFKAEDDKLNDANIPAFNPAALKDKLTNEAKNKPIKVRVFACLNSPFTPAPPPFKPPCGGGAGKKRTAWGDPEEFSTGP